MTLIPLQTKETAPELTKPILERYEKNIGMIPNLFRLLAPSPDALKGVADLHAGLGRSLGARTRERIHIMTAEVNGCDYCLTTYTYLAGKFTKLTPEDMELNRKGHSIVWRKNDPFFLPVGAEAFRRDLPEAEIRFADAGHFALEAHLDEVARIIGVFLARTLDSEQGKDLFGELNMDSVPVGAKDLVKGMADVFGFVPNLGFALGAEPAVLDVYIRMLQALGQTVLDPITQQVALGAASRINGADYAIAVHATLASKLGASKEIVGTIRNGGSLSDQAVRRFTAAIASKRTQVSDSDLKALVAAGYDRRAAVALALAAGAKTLVNAVAHLARPCLDEGFQAK